MLQSKKTGFSSTSFKMVILFLSLSFTHITLADWQWTNDSAAAPLNKDWYEAQYTFSNTGTGNISVTDLSFSCSCTVYKFKSDTAKEGGKGTLTVKVQRDNSRHNAGKELDFYAFGPTSTTAKKLTMRLTEEQQ